MSSLQLPSRELVLLDDHRPRKYPVGMRVYVAGPMTGIEDFNRMAFIRAAAQLRDAGFAVENPATNPPPNANPVWQDWMRIAIPQMLTCDGVALLDGWENSRGARLEAMIAQQMEIPIGLLEGWLS